MNLDDALAAHAEWKVKLRKAIKDQQQLDVATIGRDDCCAFGRWLHGEARLKFGVHKSYADCVGLHATFHRKASAVASLVNAKKFAEASTALDGQDYGDASLKLAVAVRRLKKEAGQ